jgi:hypothetical protein
MDEYTLLIRQGKLQNQVNDKENDIKNRREVLQTKLLSDTNAKKLQEKIGKVNEKVESLDSKEEKQREYYRNEIKLSQQKMDSEIDIIRQKADLQIKKLEDKFEAYRIYCQQQISQCEINIEKKKGMLESKKEKINLESLDEDNDVVITKMKAELKDLQKELDDYNIFINKEMARKENYIIARDNEERRKAKVEAERAEREEHDRQMVEFNNRQLEKQQIENRKEERRLENERTALTRMAEEEALEQQKILIQEEKNKRKLWKTSFDNACSKEISKLFTIINGLEIRSTERDRIMKFPTIEESIKYLEDNKDDIELVEKFRNKYWDDENDVDYFSTEIWDKYQDLSYRTKVMIVKEINRDKQVKMIKDFHKNKR